MSTDDLDAMLDSEPSVPASQPAEAPPREDVPTGEDVATPATQVQQDRDPTVPRKALEDERRKRQQLENEVVRMRQFVEAAGGRQQQQRQEPPQVDWYQDPEGAARHLQQTFDHQLREARADFVDRIAWQSERAARKNYGDELVNAARDAALEAGVAEQFYWNSEDPYEDVVSWYKGFQFAKEVNGDPEGYRKRLREELLAEIQGGGAPPAQQQPSRAPVPKSLATVPSSTVNRDQRGRFAGSQSLEEILD